MTQQSDLIPLDTSVPFVRAVCAVMDSAPGAIQEREEQALALLMAAEERHGIRIVHEPVVGSRALILAPRDPSFRPLMAEVIQLNQHLDKLWALYRDATDTESDAIERDALFPFLSDTWLLLDGPDFANNHLVWYTTGQLDSWSQRAWGDQLARWAVATDWMPAYRHLWDKGDMSYAIFCFYLYQIIDRYDRWAQTVKRLIALKCERQLAAEGASDGAT